MTISSKIFGNFVKKYYNKIYEVPEIEEVYYRGNKLVVIVKNDEIGKQLYKNLKIFKEKRIVIDTENINLFSIEKYYIDENNKVEMFCINFNSEYKEGEWNKLSKIERLIEKARFLEALHQSECYLKDLEYKDTISNFLVSLRFGHTALENEYVCRKTSWTYFIKYIHYVLSDGKDFDEFYKNISNNVICSVSDFPYKLPVIKMCYNLFISLNIPDKSIEEVLKDEKFEREWEESYSGCLIINPKDVKNKIQVIEENEAFTIYEGNLKIYNTNILEKGFGTFLSQKVSFENINDFVVENIDKPIISLEGKSIGYTFLKQETEMYKSVLDIDINFENQKEIIDFIAKIGIFTYEVCESKSEPDSPYYYRSKNSFDIKNLCVFENTLKLEGIEDMFFLQNYDIYGLRCQILLVFLNVFSRYLKRYANLLWEEIYLGRPEVKFLPPIVAEEVRHNDCYWRDHNKFFSTSLSKCGDELLDFSINKKKVADSENYYDPRIVYNPIETPFLFAEEARTKYETGIIQYSIYNYNEKKSILTADRRNLVIFEKSICISSFKKQNDAILEEIENVMPHLYDGEHVKNIEIAEIIYSSTSYDDSGMYKMIGYVTEPIKGIQLTKYAISTLNNKQLLNLAGYVLSYFDYYKAEEIVENPFDFIWMDVDNSIFYINIQDEKFKSMIPRIYYGYEYWYTYLKETVTNPYSIALINPKSRRSRLIKEAANAKKYCEKHHIFYSYELEECPICNFRKVTLPEDFKDVATKIFEDEYAVHYNYPGNNNFKIYKQSSLDISKIESNLKVMMEKQLLEKDDYWANKLHQYCFVPTERVVDETGKLIGCAYKKWSSDYFSALGYEIRESKKLSNIARINSLILLTTQITALSNENMGFITNPFGKVFVSSVYKQAIIVNVEFLSLEGDKSNTTKWLYNYICNMFASDFDLSPTASLNNFLEDFKKLAGNLEYCPIHKKLYKRSSLLCPECLEGKKVPVDYVKKEKITEKEKIGKGGEAFVYPYKGQKVAKVFKEESETYYLKSAILAAIFKIKRKVESINRQKHNYKYIIPKKLLADEEIGNVFAYIMDEVEGIPISSFRDTNEIEKYGLTMKDALEVLIATGEGIQTLHDELNMYVGDLNGENIFFDSQNKVYFIDFDGMSFETVAPGTYTEKYTYPPSYENNNITKDDDWYSFAIQTFYFLTLVHPFKGVYMVEDENGKMTNLELTERMKRKISLLGNHGIEPPNIALSWDWMNEDLKKVLLDTFEGDCRRNIVPELKRQYETVFGGKVAEETEIKDTDIIDTRLDKVIRINPKLVATQVNPFDNDIVHIINHYSAICIMNGKNNVAILTQTKRVNAFFPNCMEIRDLLLSGDNKIAFAIYETKIVAVCLETNTEIYQEEIVGMTDVVANGNTLYIATCKDEKNIILQLDFTSEGMVNKEKIALEIDKLTKKFLAKFNSKFVTVKSGSEHLDKIYCNNEEFCDIICSSESSKYTICYDDTKELWLVLNSDGNGVIINKDGTYKKLNIEAGISDSNIENVRFDRRKIYIPCDNSLYIANTKNDEVTVKKMVCRRIMTPTSQVFDINNDGFSVITNNVFYEIRKG